MPQVASAAAGATHSVWVAADGRVWAAGDNSVGQLGTGAGTEREWARAGQEAGLALQPTPTQLQSLASQFVTAAACGDGETMLCVAPGAALVFGGGRALPHRVTGAIDAHLVASVSPRVAVTTGGRVFGFAGPGASPSQVPALAGVNVARAIGIGGGRIVALSAPRVDATPEALLHTKVRVIDGLAQRLGESGVVTAEGDDDDDDNESVAASQSEEQAFA